ncbi:methyl-accepting chemotaxis protein, partial [Methylobacterium gossipiicola]
QATISYFRIDEAGSSHGNVDVAVTQLRETASRMRAPSAVVRSPKVAAAPRRPARSQPASGGFAFDMGGEDEHDADFKRSA